MIGERSISSTHNTTGGDPNPSSNYPIRSSRKKQPQPAPPIAFTSLSQSSQELIEGALGSLASLLATQSTSNSNNKSPSPVSNKSPSNFNKGPSTSKEDRPRRKNNILVRKQSTQRALTPEDLGSVPKSKSAIGKSDTNSTSSRITISSQRTHHVSTSVNIKKPAPAGRLKNNVEVIGSGSEENDEIKVQTRDRGIVRMRSLNSDRKDSPLPQPQAGILIPGMEENNDSANEDENSNNGGYNHTEKYPDFSCHDYNCIHHFHHHHHHHYYQFRDCDWGNEKPEGAGGIEPSATPSPTQAAPPGDMSFYRKFSATSPIASRSKSSLAWLTAKNTGFNFVTLFSRSRKQAKKSRSTPIKLDVMREPVELEQEQRQRQQLPFQFPIQPLVLMRYDGCNLDCAYCSFSELHCNCCCDECCCARQSRHLNAAELNDSFHGADNGDYDLIDEKYEYNGKLSLKPSPLGLARSRSIDSLLVQNDKEGEEDYRIYPVEPEVKFHKSGNPYVQSLDDDDEDDSENGESCDEEEEEADVNDNDIKGEMVSTKTETEGQNQLQRSNQEEGENVQESKEPVSEKVPTSKSMEMSETDIRSALEVTNTAETQTDESLIHKRSKNKNKNSFRVANGEVKQLPTMQMSMSPSPPPTSGTVHAPTHPLNEYYECEKENSAEKEKQTGWKGDEGRDLDSGSHESGQGSRTRRTPPNNNALMTVTVDTMSLFLDAVHLQMRQE